MNRKDFKPELAIDMLDNQLAVVWRVQLEIMPEYRQKFIDYECKSARASLWEMVGLCVDDGDVYNIRLNQENQREDSWEPGRYNILFTMALRRDDGRWGEFEDANI